MTSLRDAAENATAGVPVVPERIWATVNGASTRLPDGVRQFIGGWSEDPTRPRAVEYVKASELDTARAEIERLREHLRDATDERDNLSAIVATEIDDVAGAELDDLEERAITAESALTAAQERIAVLEGALALANRKATDRLYMATAYRQMLGPKGEQVAAMWDAKGVLRQHTDWGPAARLLTGEERAQCHLDIEEAMKTARKIEPGEIDATLSSAVKESPNA